MLAMENMDASSPAAKIVGEELHAFFERARKRLNEIREAVSLEESDKEIRRLVEFRLGFPTAKTVIGTKRSRNPWNEYECENYERVKSESGISPLSFHGFSLSRLGKSEHTEVIKTLREEYNSRPPQYQNKTTPSTPSGSTTSSTSSALGDALLPPQGAKWAAERRKAWNEIKAIVFFMSLSMLNL